MSTYEVPPGPGQRQHILLPAGCTMPAMVSLVWLAATIPLTPCINGR